MRTNGQTDRRTDVKNDGRADGRTLQSGDGKRGFGHVVPPSSRERGLHCYGVDSLNSNVHAKP